MRHLFRIFLFLIAFSLISVPTLDVAAQNGPVTITFMIDQNEFTEAERQYFMEQNPDIIVETIPEDATRLEAMFAAGNPPDVIRLWDSSVPELVANDLLFDLTDSIASTEAFDTDNLVEAAQNFVVDGRFYGLPKDWSPQFLYINTQMFEEADIPVPNTTEALTYDELEELAIQLTDRQGDRVLQVGLAFDIGLERDLQRVSMEQDLSLYSEDFSSINLTENPAAMQYLEMVYHLSQERATFSALNPSISWWGQDFLDGRVAMVPTGFWFQGMVGTAEDAVVSPEDVAILPLPTSNGVRINPMGGTVGLAISADTEHFDAAYRLFEYYNAGLPAQNRAEAGWGVPTLRSLMPLMPNETDLQLQALDMLEAEIENATANYAINPFASGGSINDVLNSMMERALNGELSFEEAMELAEEEINLVIEDGMVAAGVR